MSPGRFTSNRSSLNTRRYATLEESEAVVPVFTTPTDMYLRSELNSQTKYAPSPNQRPMYSPTSQANAQLPKHPSSPSQYGKAREQRWAFSLESSKSALKATGGKTHRPTETNANDESSDEEEDQRQEEIWKRQQEEQAESAYSLAIGSLPSGHGDLVLLSNNRAAARLKASQVSRLSV
ncbi:hypothetical protein BD560DRAFT_442579 [Blakeslea trispora]|nr:hypothetical protein BD560DRAFT_442579 [Blakeslea trispora]